MDHSGSTVVSGLTILHEDSFTWKICGLKTIAGDSSLIKLQTCNRTIKEFGTNPLVSVKFYLDNWNQGYDIHFRAQHTLPKEAEANWSSRNLVLKATADVNDENELSGSAVMSGDGKQWYQLFTIPWKMLSSIPNNNDDLDINITIQVYEPCIPDPNSCDLRKELKHKEISQILDIWEPGADADFTIKSMDGKTFPAHKYFLAGRCEYMRTMLETNMKEKNDNLVKLQISSAGVEFLLNYLYFGEVLPLYVKCPNANDRSGEASSSKAGLEEVSSNKKADLEEALHMADQFLLKDLLTFLDETLMEYCNESNCLYLYGLCKKYSLKSKPKIAKFVRKNPNTLRYGNMGGPGFLKRRNSAALASNENESKKNAKRKRSD